MNANLQRPPASGSGFTIAGTAIKDMTDASLAETLKKLEADQQTVQASLNAVLGQMQLIGAMLNVLKYELDRRANSIQLARTFPH